VHQAILKVLVQVIAESEVGVQEAVATAAVAGSVAHRQTVGLQDLAMQLLRHLKVEVLQGLGVSVTEATVRCMQDHPAERTVQNSALTTLTTVTEVTAPDNHAACAALGTALQPVQACLDSFTEDTETLQLTLNALQKLAQAPLPNLAEHGPPLCSSLLAAMNNTKMKALCRNSQWTR
jgi:hypothetical protein